MAGFGPNVESVWWFRLYWLLVMLILTGVTVMCWKRGIHKKYFSGYLKKLKTKQAIAFNGVFVLLTLAVASYIFYNTSVRNKFVGSVKWEKRLVNYEKMFKHFEKQNQPKIQDIKLYVDIFPEKETMTGKGSFLLKNMQATPIDTLFVMYDYKEITVHDLPASLAHTSKDMGVYLYKMYTPLLPGDTLRFDFDLHFLPNGFTNDGNSSTIMKNGTFINSSLFPSFNYNSQYEISRDKRRKKLGLEPKDLMPPTDDEWGRTRNYVSNDGDWVSFEAFVSTSADQIALAPGKLITSETRDGRNHYHYRTETDMINFYTVLSARYDVKKEIWTAKDIDHQPVELEIYYHPAHTYNIDNMMTGLKESLTHYTKVYGDYEHSVLRIAEFPRYGYYAQAFATLIPFSEGVGFIADTRKGKTIDYPFYITAHETGHQWWAHQVIGGFVRGTVMLAESFTEYSSLMVVKKNYSEKLYREQLKYVILQYISMRGGVTRVELPLAQCEMQQYLFYQKGMLTMNALSRLISEESVNQALQQFLQEVKYQSQPYTNTAAFMEVLDPFVPDSLKATVDEMFNQVVIYDHKIIDATWSELEDESIVVNITFTTERREYDSEGKSETTEYDGWMEIALLDRKSEIIQVEKVPVNGKENHVSFHLDQIPTSVVLDPYFVTLAITPYELTSKVKEKDLTVDDVVWEYPLP
jgi:hypothetical protein